MGSPSFASQLYCKCSPGPRVSQSVILVESEYQIHPLPNDSSHLNPRSLANASKGTDESGLTDMTALEAPRTSRGDDLLCLTCVPEMPGSEEMLIFRAVSFVVDIVDQTHIIAVVAH